MNLELISAESELSAELEDLATYIETQAGVTIERQYVSPRTGDKVVDLVALGLLITAVGTAASIIGLWLEARPNIVIETEVRGNKVTIKNPTTADIEALLTGEIERADTDKVRIVLLQKTAES